MKKTVEKLRIFVAVTACVLLCTGFLRPFESVARADREGEASEETGLTVSEESDFTVSAEPAGELVPYHQGMGEAEINGEVKLQKLSDEWFTGDATAYNPELCELSAVLSMLCYSDYTGKPGVLIAPDGEMDIVAYMEYMGLEDVQDIEVPKDAGLLDIHRSEMFVGHKSLPGDPDGRELLAVMVRGTNGTAAEWASNFDIGIDSFGQSDWKHRENHAGFDITSGSVEEAIAEYEETVGASDYIYWFAGHSRGAAIADLVAAERIDAGKKVLAYTFAGPGVTLSKEAASEKYYSIFNVINRDDLVPRVPLESWGYTLFGRIAYKDIGDDIKADYGNYFTKNGEALTYNGDGDALDRLVEALARVIPAGSDPIDAVFELGCEHVTGIKGSGISARLKTKKAQNYYDALPESVKEKAHVVPDETDDKYSYICIPPAAIIKCFAAMFSDDLSALEKASIFEMLGEFDSIDDVISSIMDMMESNKLTSPHMPYVYYLYQKNITAADFVLSPVRMNKLFPKITEAVSPTPEPTEELTPTPTPTAADDKKEDNKKEDGNGDEGESGETPDKTMPSSETADNESSSGSRLPLIILLCVTGACIALKIGSVVLGKKKSAEQGKK